MADDDMRRLVLGVRRSGHAGSLPGVLGRVRKVDLRGSNVGAAVVRVGFVHLRNHLPAEHCFAVLQVPSNVHVLRADAALGWRGLEVRQLGALLEPPRPRRILRVFNALELSGIGDSGAAVEGGIPELLGEVGEGDPVGVGVGGLQHVLAADRVLVAVLHSGGGGVGDHVVEVSVAHVGGVELCLCHAVALLAGAEECLQLRSNSAETVGAVH
mmetsp:Transcript_2105/g.7635  ORF Transcript_2105/g.7635 Transcript_2105/m.7635 type:complete len:213 (-) Transcript_2105:655-1293(-)